jgi:hypothetical protein
MVLMRGLIVSWFVVLSLVLPIGGQLLFIPTSDCMASEAAEMEEPSASDETFTGVGRIGTGEKARRPVLLVITGSHPVGTCISLSAPSLERAMAAVPLSSARPVYQQISVYRI